MFTPRIPLKNGSGLGNEMFAFNSGGNNQTYSGIPQVIVDIRTDFQLSGSSIQHNTGSDPERDDIFGESYSAVLSGNPPLPLRVGQRPGSARFPVRSAPDGAPCPRA